MVFGLMIVVSGAGSRGDEGPKAAMLLGMKMRRFKCLAIWSTFTTPSTFTLIASDGSPSPIAAAGGVSFINAKHEGVNCERERESQKKQERFKKKKEN